MACNPSRIRLWFGSVGTPARPTGKKPFPREGRKVRSATGVTNDRAGRASQSQMADPGRLSGSGGLDRAALSEGGVGAPGRGPDPDFRDRAARVGYVRRALPVRDLGRGAHAVFRRPSFAASRFQVLRGSVRGRARGRRDLMAPGKTAELAAANASGSTGPDFPAVGDLLHGAGTDLWPVDVTDAPGCALPALLRPVLRRDGLL